MMVSDAGYLGMDVNIGAEEIEDGKFLWNNGTPLIPGTPLWRQKLEGFDRYIRCVIVSSAHRLSDNTCARNAFVCQYDV